MIEQHLALIISILTLITFLFVFRDRIFIRGSKEQNISDRVANLEKSDCDINNKITDINKDIKSIKENHLHHIEKDISKINVNLGEINTALKFITKEK
jgi:peptidoglycan hydrolase CwlO-like protein